MRLMDSAEIDNAYTSLPAIGRNAADTFARALRHDPSLLDDEGRLKQMVTVCCAAEFEDDGLCRTRNGGQWNRFMDTHGSVVCLVGLSVVMLEIAELEKQDAAAKSWGGLLGKAAIIAGGLALGQWLG